MTSFTFSLDEILAAPPAVRYWVEQRLGHALARLAPPRDARDVLAAPQLRVPFITPQHAATVIPLRDGATQVPFSAVHEAPMAGPLAADTSSADVSPTAMPPAAMSPVAMPPIAMPAPPGLDPSMTDYPFTIGAPPAAGGRDIVTGCSVAEAVQILNRIDQDVTSTQVFFELSRACAGVSGSDPDHALCAVDAAAIMRHARLPDGQQLLACLGKINHAFRLLRGRGDISLFGIDRAGQLYVHVATSRAIRQIWDELLAAQAASAPMPARVGPAA